MKNVLFGSIILLCVTLSVCAIVRTSRGSNKDRVEVTYKKSTGDKEVHINIANGSIDGALDDVREIDSLWKAKHLGSSYYY